MQLSDLLMLGRIAGETWIKALKGSKHSLAMSLEVDDCFWFVMEDILSVLSGFRAQASRKPGIYHKPGSWRSAIYQLDDQ